MKKLDPQLQLLVHRLNGTLHPHDAEALADLPPIGETVHVTIEFRGELGDLQALGSDKHSLVAHPIKGYKVATGTIPTHSLEALAQIDHVVVVSAPHPLRPLLNDTADKIRALALHPGNAAGAVADAAITLLPMALLSRRRRRR